jgi:2-polyprenyl-6-hydroxyphenyl methylase/3-demethylubiquinone-9 3-methyltransferase
MQAGERFGFGANWSRFLRDLDDARIAAAEASLKEMLGVARLDGLTFLDIGCGSGLFSLAARRLGAAVRSFDFDPQSVACAQELKKRYFVADDDWRIEVGSVLDRDYMAHLGRFDVVYSWGVLHHTGAMWLALERAISCVAPGSGKLYIAIYNDQGWKSHLWWLVKAFYNRLPRWLQGPFVAVAGAVVRMLVVLKYTIKLKPWIALAPLASDRRERGMSARHDRIDWFGGFPFEVAGFEVLTAYLEARGFSMIGARRNTSHGCSEFAAQLQKAS